jgi:hypothetical protein
VSGWQDLVTASLIGTERAVVPAAEIPGVPAPADPNPDPAAEIPGAPAPAGPGPDPAAVLLGRAALLTAARRAGRRPGHADPLPQVEADPRPAVSPAAGLRLARMLQGHNPELLAEWLAAAAARGLRPPPQLLPALLDRARRPGPAETAPSQRAPSQLALPRLVAEAGGPRTSWLAALNPDWEYAAAWLAALNADPASATAKDQAGDDAWRLGRTAQRRGYLAALLARDPAAARELVSGGWAAAGPGERAMFLAVLAEGLIAADEPLLEAALDDQAEEVRSWAAYLLARLPGSALGRRMAARARHYLRLEQGARGPRLTVLPPAGSDRAMRRDGITPGPAAGRSQLADRTRLMLEVMSRTPLGTWTEEFGLTAAQIAAVPAGDWAPVLLVGWSRAAIAQNDQDWMAALVNRALTGRRPGTTAEFEALRQLARHADPALGGPGAVPEREPDAPHAALGMLRVLRFRYQMLKELDNGPGVD